MWQRQIQCLQWSARLVDQPDRLGVVDDHDVELALERVGVQLRVAAEDLLLLLGERGLVALEPVVDRLRDVEELVLAVDDPPLGVEARVLHERDERVQDLGHAAAERGRREVQDAQALERLRERGDLVHETAPGDRGVVRENLVTDVDGLKLQAAPRIAAPSVEILDEPQARAALVRFDLELVGHRLDDREAEPALVQVLGRAGTASTEKPLPTSRTSTASRLPLTS